MDILNQIVAGVTANAPRLLGALAILVVGWLVALALGAAVRGLMRKTGMEGNLRNWMRLKPDADIAGGAGKGVTWLVMAFVLVATFQTLGLTLITEPLNGLLNGLFDFAPNLLGGLALLVVALVVANVARAVLRRVLTGMDIDTRLGTRGEARDASAGEASTREAPLAHSLADTSYWLVLLLFLPAVLGALGMAGLLEPVSGLVGTILGYLPQIAAAAVLLAVGWFVARIVQKVVTGLLSAAGADRLGERLGLGTSLGSRGLSGLLGTVVYALILVPVVIASLNALQLEAVTAPASAMLATLLAAVPQVLAAALILGISYAVGKLIAGLVSNVLGGVGFDRLPGAVGLNWNATRTPSQLVGTLVLVAVLLLAAAEASSQLGFTAVSALTTQFIAFAGQVLLGLAIFTAGLFLANLAAGAVNATGNARPWTARLVRTAVLVLASAMALRRMGFANEIVELAFGLMLGAVAVAAAIAFGIGGRDAAAEQLRSWKGTELKAREARD